MKYWQIEPMCRPLSGARGCPHDGLGCTGTKCSINDPRNSFKAYNASQYGPDFFCQKRATAIRRQEERGHG